jgi:hypothetical protein
MKDHTINPYVRATVTDLLLHALGAIGDKIFQADDRWARDHGWRIVPRRGGLSRSYRDPRFDRLVACATCNGRGCNPQDATCSACHGAGCIALDPAAVSPPGRG